MLRPFIRNKYNNLLEHKKPSVPDKTHQICNLNKIANRCSMQHIVCTNRRLFDTYVTYNMYSNTTVKFVFSL